MTTSPAPFSDDELSAALDGELGAARAAELALDPEAVARQRSLAAAAARVAEPVTPLDAATIDDLVRTALDPPLAPAAPRRGRRGPHPGLVAAAVLLLVGIGLGLVWSGRGADDEKSAETADRLADSATGGGVAKDEATSEMSEAPSHSGGVPTTTAPAPSTLPEPVALGAFADGDALRTALAVAFPAADITGVAGSGVPTPPTPPTAAAVQRCREQLQVTLKLAGPPTRTGYATVDGRPVLVYEFEAKAFDDGTPTTLVAAVGQDACDQVVIFQR